MSERAVTEPMGRVLCSSTTGFVAGCQALQPQTPNFGSLVKVELREGLEIIGLIYNVSVGDDPLVRQLIGSFDISEEVIRDQRENRQMPIEVSVLTVGFRERSEIYQYLPPQPPPALNEIFTCNEQETIAFTADFGYFRPILGAGGEIPADELLAASLRQASLFRGRGKPDREFLIRAGRELARLLAEDPVRLDGLLRRIRA
jgi:hypothetical protein